MTTLGFVLVGDEPLPYAPEAIQAVGMSNGDRVATMDQLMALTDAEAAYYDARLAIYRAHMAALLGQA